MTTQIVTMFAIIAALLAGGAIGYCFGIVQAIARRKNEEREKVGNLKSGWSLMPGSGARVAYLLIALVIVQVVCPLIFNDSTKWWVSGGVALGYGVSLFRQLRQRLAGSK